MHAALGQNIPTGRLDGRKKGTEATETVALIVQRSKGDYALASSSPQGKVAVALYSMWRTRLGMSVWDFEEEWINSGRMARMPPCGTRQSTGFCLWTISSTTASVSTPRL